MSVTVQDFLRKGWRVFLICGLAGSAAAFSVFRFLVKPVYASSVKCYVDIIAPRENGLTDSNYAQRTVNTCIEILKTDSFFRSVRNSAGLTESVADLKDMTDFTVLNDSQVFEIRISSHNAVHSRFIADLMGRLAPDAIHSVEQEARIKVIDPAEFPERPDFPNLLLDSVMGFLLGMVSDILLLLLKSRRARNQPEPKEEELL